MTRNDPTGTALHALAKEFDSRAAALEAETKAAMLIGYGDDIGDGTRTEMPNGDSNG
jgi:hypothetical protein